MQVNIANRHWLSTDGGPLRVLTLIYLHFMSSFEIQKEK